MGLSFPSEHVTDVPLRSLVIESTLREELLGSPFSTVTDDVNRSPGPQVWVLRGSFRLWLQLSWPSLELTIQMVAAVVFTTQVNLTSSPGHIPLDGPVN